MLRYLVAVVEHEEPLAGVLEIGRPDVVSYADMIGDLRRGRRACCADPSARPVPVLSPRLSSLWVGLVTPVPAQLARPLVDSLVNRVVVTDHRAEEIFPFARLSLTEAIRLAITNTASGKVPTKFDDASSPVWQSSSTDPDWTGGTVVTDVREQTTTADPHSVWRALCRIGGARGWYSGALLWQVRGAADRVVGGPGLRGRRDPERLSVGEPLDWWRVSDLELDHSLALHAEMRLPGEAWLEWSIEPASRRWHAAIVSDGSEYRPSGPVRAGVLVRGSMPFPLARVPRDAARHRAGRRVAGRCTGADRSA